MAERYIVDIKVTKMIKEPAKKDVYGKTSAEAEDRHETPIHIISTEDSLHRALTKAAKYIDIEQRDAEEK